MGVEEVERIDGVGRGLISLLRLWKSVEKCRRVRKPAWKRRGSCTAALLMAVGRHRRMCLWRTQEAQH